MCNEREKLIGYLYDEGDSGERDAVRDHLESCAECRAEIAELRSVREDLAAWEVPEHGSVWRPFAVAPTPRWWQHVPRWALATAAGLVLVSGAVGGAVTQAVMPQTTSAAQTVPAGATQVSAPAEVAAMQQEIIRLRQELSQLNVRVLQASAAAVTPDVEAALHKTFDRQLSDLRCQSDRQFEAVQSLYMELSNHKRVVNLKVAGLRTDMEGLATAVGARSGGHQ
jgi:anti-sigma factor RsiW